MKEITLYAVFRESDDTDIPLAIFPTKEGADAYTQYDNGVIAPFIVPLDALQNFYRSGRLRYRKWFAEQVKTRLTNPHR